MLKIIKRVFSFSSWATSHPNQPPPGDMLDAQFDEIIDRVSEWEDKIRKVVTADGKLSPDAIDPKLFAAAFAGNKSAPQTDWTNEEKEAFSADQNAMLWAEVSSDWAEHMPDGLPSDSLAWMGITGDHWSARWWANHAAQLVSEASSGQVDNHSMPFPVSAINPVIMYITMTGSDITDGNPLHGATEEKAFATWDAALAHAKVTYRFTGTQNAVEFRFGPGSWGAVFIGHGTNYYGFHGNTESLPFAVAITSIDDDDRASFAGVGVSSWNRNTVYVYKVRSTHFVAMRSNILCVQDVDVIAPAGGVIDYCFRFTSHALLYIWGKVDVLEPATYTYSFFNGSEYAICLPENGDPANGGLPAIFPGFVLSGQSNITSPHKYRVIWGAYMVCMNWIYPQLTYAADYYVDSSSFSSQTVFFGARETDSSADGNYYPVLRHNDGEGGPVVGKFGDTNEGYRLYADGWSEQWGTATITNAATGVTLDVATVTLTVPMLSATYAASVSWNTPNILVTRSPSGTTTSVFKISVNNFHASPQSATVKWRAIGFIA